MKRLEAAGLYGNGLVSIDTPTLAKRYNECLEAAGVVPTALERFRIDGLGWSPEVAAEKGDGNYLSHGPSNPLGVVLTPNQRGKPSYISFFSFQRELMNQYFSRYGREIADLTAQTGLWLDFDQGLSHYRTPMDLLQVGDVTVRTAAVGGIQEACREQRRLVGEFLAPGEGWFDPRLRAALLESARACGDLRSRNLFIPDMVFSDTEVFYTKAFGGVYVFRGLASCANLMVFEDPARMPHAPDESTRVYAADDLAWLALLLNEGVFEIDLAWHAAHPDDLERVQECMLADLICTHDPAADFGALTSAQKKGYIQRMRADMPDIYFELEVLTRRLRAKNAVLREDLSLEAQAAACHPRRNMPPLLRSILWQMASCMLPTDVWRTYHHNKELFYSLYESWPEPRKSWAIELVRKQISKRAEG